VNPDGVAFGDLFYRGYSRRIPVPDLAGFIPGERARLPAGTRWHLPRPSAGAYRLLYLAVVASPGINTINPIDAIRLSRARLRARMMCIF